MVVTQYIHGLPVVPLHSNIEITYIPWHLRGFDGKAWQVYIEIDNSHSLSQLIEVKQQLNNPPVTGLVLAENRSPALRRLGWKELDNGLWYKIFP